MFFCKKIKKVINQENLPQHLAFIMDGNGRWATKRGLPRCVGHKEGVNAMKRVVNACVDYGIKYVSFFAFSTENWKRPKEEINYIFSLANDFINSFINENEFKNIKILTMGDITKLPSYLQKSINNIKEKTKLNNGLVVNIAINYGGKQDIINAFNKAIEDGVKYFDEKILNEYLSSNDIPNPDMIIRTSGEQRISNFMLYQMAYSELCFPKVYWPDFSKENVLGVIQEFQKRIRRYGGLK